MVGAYFVFGSNGALDRPPHVQAEAHFDFKVRNALSQSRVVAVGVELGAPAKARHDDYERREGVVGHLRFRV